MPKAILLADLLSWWFGKAGVPGMERVYWEIVEWTKGQSVGYLQQPEILFGTIAHDRIPLAGEEALVFLETIWMLEKGLWDWQADAPLPDAPARANCAEFDLWKKYLTLAEVRRVWARRLAVAAWVDTVEEFPAVDAGGPKAKPFPWHIRELSRPDFDLLFRFCPRDQDDYEDGEPKTVTEACYGATCDAVGAGQKWSGKTGSSQYFWFNKAKATGAAAEGWHFQWLWDPNPLAPLRDAIRLRSKYPEYFEQRHAHPHSAALAATTRWCHDLPLDHLAGYGQENWMGLGQPKWGPMPSPMWQQGGVEADAASSYLGVRNGKHAGCLVNAPFLFALLRAMDCPAQVLVTRIPDGTLTQYWCSLLPNPATGQVAAQSPAEAIWAYDTRPQKDVGGLNRWLCSPPAGLGLSHGDMVLPTDGRDYAHPLAAWQSASTLVARLRLLWSAEHGDLAVVFDRRPARAFAIGFLLRSLKDRPQYHSALRTQAMAWATKHKVAVATLKAATSPKWVEQAQASLHVSRHRFFGVRKKAGGGPNQDGRFPADWSSALGLPGSEVAAATPVWIECDEDVAKAIDAFADEVAQ